MCGAPVKIKIIAIVLTIAHPANLCALEITPRAIYESHYQLLILRRLLCRTLLRLLTELGATDDQQAGMEHHRRDGLRLRRPDPGTRQLGIGRLAATGTRAHPDPRLQYR